MDFPMILQKVEVLDDGNARASFVREGSAQFFKPILTADEARALGPHVGLPFTMTITGPHVPERHRAEAWTCDLCGHENQGSVKCARCQFIRHRADWHCDQCGQRNKWTSVACERCGCGERPDYKTKGGE